MLQKHRAEEAEILRNGSRSSHSPGDVDTERPRSTQSVASSDILDDLYNSQLVRTPNVYNFRDNSPTIIDEEDVTNGYKLLRPSNSHTAELCAHTDELLRYSPLRDFFLQCHEL